MGLLTLGQCIVTACQGDISSGRCAVAAAQQPGLHMQGPSMCPRVKPQMGWLDRRSWLPGLALGSAVAGCWSVAGLAFRQDSLDELRGSCAAAQLQQETGHVHVTLHDA